MGKGLHPEDKPEFRRKTKMPKVNISKGTNVDRDCNRVLGEGVGEANR